MKALILSATVFLFIILCPTSLQGQSQRDSLKRENLSEYHSAVEALKSRTFGIDPEYLRRGNGAQISLFDDLRSFIGFEDQKLILQGIFTGDERHDCDVTNYFCKEDKKGNVTVTFDYKGRVLHGDMKIKMKYGDNYAEVYYNQFIPLQGNQVRMITGIVLPSDECNYIEMIKEVGKPNTGW